MKIKKNISKKSIIIIAVCAVFIASCVTATWLLLPKNNPSQSSNNSLSEDEARGINSVDYSDPTDEQIKAGEHAAAEAEKQGDSSQSNNKQTAAVNFTAINQSDTVLQIRVLISTVTNSGNCTLTLTSEDKTVTRKTSVQSLANSSTCTGFEIPLSDLRPGSWDAVLIFENDATSGKTSTLIKIE